MPIDDVITIWKNGDWQIWNGVDAMYARCDPDWQEEHQLPVAVAGIMISMSNHVTELEKDIVPKVEA